MIEQGLPAADFELAYERLAEALDSVGRARESEFLAGLALLLMQAAPEISAVLAAIDAAQAALD